MALFDTKTFFYNAGRGENPTTALGAAFGMPYCLISLGEDLLSLLPRSVLDPMRRSTQDGVTAADDAIKSALASIGFLDGIIEYDTETGSFRLVSDSSRNGMDRNDSDDLNSVGGFLGAAFQAAAFAGRLYNNYETAVNQINAISDCIQSYSDYLNYTGGAKANQRSRLDPDEYEALFKQYDIIKKDIEEATQFRDQAISLLQTIDQILEERDQDPTLEPVFLAEFSSIVSGANVLIEPLPMPEKVEEIFRLKFGPPVSKTGKFILSVDGLYYDSQTSGIIPALIEIENRKSNLENSVLWKLDFDPSLGGRGKQISLETLKSYIDTILDPSIINESNFIRQYYDVDEFLGELIGQKNRRIFDLSSQIVELQEQETSEILISNMRQVMLSEASHHQQKINKRKKQIELAVLMPSIYKNEIVYKPGDEIPVNDFSYLQGINYKLDIEKQKSLVLSQNEVSGVILPVVVKYVQQLDQPEKIILDHLLINNIGIGAIVADGSGLMAPELTITDRIEKEGLIALYNFLKFDLVDPSSTKFTLNNSSELSHRMDAQLVGEKENIIFEKGVGIARLDGITKHSQSSTSTPSAVGSYIKLPDEKELQDLLYNKKGATFEAWVHVPGINQKAYYNDGNVSGLYRLLLANENIGFNSTYVSQNDITRIRNDKSSNVAKGLIFGFTVDQRLTSDEEASNSPADNSIENACLVLAPTQAFNSSSIGFINKSYDLYGRCFGLSSLWHGMRFPIFSSVNGASLVKANDEFCQIAFTLDPVQNKVSFYCDGQLLTTSSYFDVFGIDPVKEAVNIPTLKFNNSFEYNTTSMANVNVSKLKTGPRLGSYFTPWVIGGGFTDGMQTGNFMGGQYGGKISGLRGFVGGIKIYSKPLTQEQVLKNFNSSKNFFKNININDNFAFKVIGTDDVLDSPFLRFTSVTTDGEDLYIGAENINSSATVWKYNENDKWSNVQLTASSFSSVKAIGDIKSYDGNLFLATMGSSLQQFAAGLYLNSGVGWDNIFKVGLQPTVFDSSFRTITRSDSGDIYAAGTATFIWKYSAGSWSEVYYTNTGDALNTHWIDLVTSGNELYAACSRVFTSGVVYKFDGTSTWTQLSPIGFGQNTNYAVTKLCIYDGKLHAATLNDYTGCQIWQYDGASWTKINENGFGDNYNYNVVSMKVIDERLVVSVENPYGGEVWSYSNSTGWIKETITTPVVYNSYLIETLGNRNYLVGKSVRRMMIQADGAIYTANQRIQKGLNTWPDNSFNGIPIGNNKYRFFGANALFTCITEGTLDDPAETLISDYSYSITLSAGNLGAAGPLGSKGYVRGFAISNLKSDASSYVPSSSFYNSSILAFVSSNGLSYNEVKPYGLKYYAGSMAYAVPNTNYVALIAHTESGYWSGTQANPVANGQGWYGSLRLAISHDNGLTFSDAGDIIKSSAGYAGDITSSGPIFSDRIGLGNLIKRGDYMYLYYWGDQNRYTSATQQFCVARCPVTEFDTAIQNVSAPKFYKYYNGSYSESGVSGLASDISDKFAAPNYCSVTMYSLKLNKFVTFFNSNYLILENTLFFGRTNTANNLAFTNNTYVSYSDDGINFSMPELINIQKDSGGIYISVLSDRMHFSEFDDSVRVIQYENQDWEAVGLSYKKSYPQSIPSKTRTYNTVTYGI